MTEPNFSCFDHCKSCFCYIQPVGIWQAIPCLVVLCNRSIIRPLTLLYLSHPFAYELTRSNVFYFALPLAVLPACCYCLIYFNTNRSPVAGSATVTRHKLVPPSWPLSWTHWNLHGYCLAHTRITPQSLLWEYTRTACKLTVTAEAHWNPPSPPYQSPSLIWSHWSCLCHPSLLPFYDQPLSFLISTRLAGLCPLTTQMLPMLFNKEDEEEDFTAIDNEDEGSW